MFPPEKYAGDLPEKVPSMNSNSNSWRGMRDMAMVLKDMAQHPATGPVEMVKVDPPPFTPAAPEAPAKSKPTTGGADEPEIAHLRPATHPMARQSQAAALRVYPTQLSQMSEGDVAKLLAATADEYRKTILAAFDKAIDRSVDPPFHPLDLRGKEKPYYPITDTSPGSYWNIMIGYLHGSGVYAYNSKYADEMVDYFRSQGGVFMGINRSELHHSQWNVKGATGTNMLYGSAASSSISSATTSTTPLSTSTATLLRVLLTTPSSAAKALASSPRTSAADSSRCRRTARLIRISSGNCGYMLVQDFDLDDDGQPETLRLLFATPHRWLEDNKTIEVKNAPTAFGPVSITTHALLSQGNVLVDIELPKVAPEHTYLTARALAIQSHASPGL